MPNVSATIAPIDAQPYAWPWNGRAALGRIAIVVAGTQRYWFERTVGAPAALAVLDRLMQRLRPIGVPVIRIRHGRSTARRLAVPLRQSMDADMVPMLDPEDIVVDAAGLDGCFGSPLDDTLRSLGTPLVLIAGLGLEGPVHSTLRSLNDRGYECLTITDAVAPGDAALAAAAISTITFSFGIFGAVAPAAAVLAAFTPEVVTT